MKKLIIILFVPLSFAIYVESSWTLSVLTNAKERILDIFTISIFWWVSIFLFTNLKGNIDFSFYKTRINLIVSIIWVVVIWFLTPILLWELPTFKIYYIPSQIEKLSASMPFKISIFILLTTPIWIYWLLKPLYFWIKEGKT